MADKSVAEMEAEVRAAWAEVIVFDDCVMIDSGVARIATFQGRVRGAAIESAFVFTEQRREDIRQAEMVYAHLADDTEDGCGCPQGVREYLLKMMQDRLAALKRGWRTEGR